MISDVAESQKNTEPCNRNDCRLNCFHMIANDRRIDDLLFLFRQNSALIKQLPVDINVYMDYKFMVHKTHKTQLTLLICFRSRS